MKRVIAVMAAVLASLAMGAGQAAAWVPPPINLPVRSDSLVFNAKADPPSNPITIYSPGDGKRYLARLEPSEDANGGVFMLQVVLTPEGEPDHANLLEPKGDWHGAQPYMIYAEDLTRPSIFGASRVFRLPELKMTLTIVLGDGVARRSGDGYAFDKVNVGIQYAALY